MSSSRAARTLAAPARESAAWRMLDIAVPPTGPVGEGAAWLMKVVVLVVVVGGGGSGRGVRQDQLVVIFLL